MAKAKVQEVESVEEAVETTDQAVPESINLSDLGLLAQIVDLATQRGAFRANELSQVGTVYDKLNSFLSYVQAQQAEAQANEEAAEETAAEE